MSIKQRIDAQTDALSALLTYANNATGKGDADIGEAIRTLVDGFGKGGGGALRKAEGIITTNYARAELIIQHNLATDLVFVTVEPVNDALSTTAPYRIITAFFTNAVHQRQKSVTTAGAELNTSTLSYMYGGAVIVGNGETSLSTLTCNSTIANIKNYVTPSADGNTVTVRVSNTSGMFEKDVPYKWTVYDLKGAGGGSDGGNVLFETAVTSLGNAYSIEITYPSDDIYVLDKNFVAVLSCDNDASVVASWAHRVGEELCYGTMVGDYLSCGSTTLIMELYDGYDSFDIWDLGQDTNTFQQDYTYRIKLIAY